MTMMVKKMPMDSVMPAFWNVERIPEAAPRRLPGTAFMMPAVFGAANRPMARPLSSSSGANIA
jgi:hypothetical protein